MAKLPYIRPAHLGLSRTLAAGLLLAGCSQTPDFGAPPRSVILVCIDTLRADHVGAYGYAPPTTPNLDRLASEGTLFESTVAQSNWTVPATATLLTSLYPSEHGARIEGDSKHLGKTPPAQLRPGVETLADILQPNGFRTGLFSANPFLYGRFKRGFDAAEVELQSATSLTAKAIAWIAENPAEPFFLHLQYMDLHRPIEPPEPYFNYFAVPAGGPRGSEHKAWRFVTWRGRETAAFKRYRGHKIALYDGALRYVDAEIGRLLDTLEELGILDETLLVVTSDHGEELWDHAQIEKTLATDPRRIWGVGHGHSMFQELIRVPLIFRGPGVAAAARVACEARHLDVAPTILALLGLEPQPRMRGVSLAPRWSGATERRCDGVPQIAESPAYGPEMQTIIWRQHKLVAIRGEAELLFDLRADPGERHDLARQLPAVVTALEEMLARELPPAGSPAEESGESPASDLDADTERQLRALGYLGN